MDNIVIVTFQTMENFTGTGRLFNFAVGDAGRNVFVPCVSGELIQDIWPRAQALMVTQVNTEFNTPDQICWANPPLVDAAQLVVSNAKAAGRR